jgi:hypothetical protein
MSSRYTAPRWQGTVQDFRFGLLATSDYTINRSIGAVFSHFFIPTDSIGEQQRFAKSSPPFIIY